jgi:hypothetical protein
MCKPDLPVVATIEEGPSAVFDPVSLSSDEFMPRGSDGVRVKSYWCRNPRTRFNSHVVSRMNADLALLEKRPVGGSYLQATFTSDRLHAVPQSFRRNECHLRASWSCIATLRSQLSLSRSPPSRCSAFEGSKADVERFQAASEPTAKIERGNYCAAWRIVRTSDSVVKSGVTVCTGSSEASGHIARVILDRCWAFSGLEQ